MTQKTMSQHPFDFHVRYYWEGRINFVVLNPEVDVTWAAPLSGISDTRSTDGFRHRMSQFMLKIVRSLLAQRRRNANLFLPDLLACPSCHSADLSTSDELITCKGCGQAYPVRRGIPVMYPATKPNHNG